MTLAPGMIVYVNYPYTDTFNAQNSKPRPCLVVAVNNNFFWGLQITSSRQYLDDFLYELSSSDCGFPLGKISFVRCDIIMTFTLNSVIKHVTTLTNDAYERIHSIMTSMINTGIPPKE